MKITKYAQSCGLVETKQGKRILVDPGDYEFDEKLLDTDWINIDYIFVTHKHGDHCYTEIINKIIERDGAKLYTTQEVKESTPELTPEIVKEGDVIDLGEGLKAEVTKAVHGWIPLFKGGNKFPEENVGYIIDDGDKRAYFTGDTIAFDNDYQCDVIFLPVCGHGLMMGPWEGAMFAKMTEASIVIPCHADAPKHPVNWDYVKSEFDSVEVEYKKLVIGESVEI